MSPSSIAIIGIGCRFPQARTPDEFWQLLRDGVDAVSEISSKRAELSQYEISGSTSEPLTGGFLEEIDQFDPQFFGLSAEEAIAMDPQQRLLLEVAWEALENAGQVPAQLTGSRTGVFIGVARNPYERLVESAGVQTAYGSTSYNACIAPNRISYQFNFQGPSLAINTACSSSLVALHQALQSLRSGETDMAMVGGANLVLSPQKTENLRLAGLISSTGRCRSFADSADGYVRSEGVGMVILKRLEDAIAAGDRIYATILSSAINHNGKGNGLSGPNPQAQKTLLKQAYKAANLSPAEVQYIEANGSGTQLGDALELNALGEVLKQDRPDRQPCLVGSVKTNLGSAEVASGMAGLIKVALALHHRQIPPHLHLDQPNKYVDFTKVPLAIPTELQPWPETVVPSSQTQAKQTQAKQTQAKQTQTGQTQASQTQANSSAIAGVSAFGLGGTNVHVVLSAPTQIPKSVAPQRPQPQSEALLLSAKSEPALRAIAQRYQAFLRQNPDLSLRDVCYTASVRRSHFPYRLAIVSASIEDLQQQLSERLVEQDAAFCHKVTRRSRKKITDTMKTASTKAVSVSQLCDPTSAVSAQERSALLQALAQQWLQGITVDWPQLFEACNANTAGPQLVRLPPYAFDHQSYWPAPAAAVDSSVAIPACEAVANRPSPSVQDNRTVQNKPVQNNELSVNEFVEPRTRLEKQLVNSWEKGLNIRPIGIRDNFFDLGGTSLLAQSIFAEFSRKTGLQFPLNQLFQTPTVEAIACALTNATSDSLSNNISEQAPNLIVPLNARQASGTIHSSRKAEAPLFLVHAAGSSILFYQPLVQQMQTQRPIYGIQPTFLDSTQSRLATVKDIAAHYISQIRLIQPQGPYAIGGASFGGLVSYEIAQQLTQQGETVETLILFDHAAPGARSRARWQQRYGKYWKDFLQGGPNYLRPIPQNALILRLQKRFRYEYSDLQILLRQQKYLLRQKLHMPAKGIVGNTFRSHIKMAQRYRLKPYSGSLVLIKATAIRNHEPILESDLGWSHYVQGAVQVLKNNGGHMSMFKAPHVTDLAQQIDRVLAKGPLGQEKVLADSHSKHHRG